MSLFFILYALAAICILDEPFSAVLYIFLVHILLFLFLFVDSLDQNLHTDQVGIAESIGSLRIF